MVSQISSDNLKSLMSVGSNPKLVKDAVQSIIDDIKKETGSSKLSEETRQSIIKALEINYSQDEESDKSISDMIKEYTKTVSENIKNMSKNDNTLSLKDKIKNMSYGNLSKSTYESVGMGEYYNMKSLMDLSQAITAYSKNFTTMTTVKLGGTNYSNSNFTINL